VTRAALLALLLLAAPAARAGEAIATFAGGCFWCMEPPFEELPGVLVVRSGYTGGTDPDPSYDEVSEGGTGHAEAVQIVYDPALVSYAKLLDVFWHNIDPTVADRQFCDVGSQYRSAVFVHDAAQRQAAEASREAVRKALGVPVRTEIIEATRFHPAEAKHQDYAKQNPLRYRYYRTSCGRDARLEEIWGPQSPGHPSHE
jgi:peptide-methionine (S)-S-oxide reductase